jgi:hypothetical protein
MDALFKGRGRTKPFLQDSGEFISDSPSYRYGDGNEHGNLGGSGVGYGSETGNEYGDGWGCFGGREIPPDHLMFMELLRARIIFVEFGE